MGEERGVGKLSQNEKKKSSTEKLTLYIILSHLCKITHGHD